MVRRQQGLLSVFVAAAVREAGAGARAGEGARLRRALQRIHEGEILARPVDGGEAPTPAAPPPRTPSRGRAR